MYHVLTITQASGSIIGAISTKNITTDDGIQVVNPKILGFYIPSSWTAADLTFLGATGDSSYYSIFDSAGNEFRLAYNSSQSYVMVDPEVFDQHEQIQIRSGSKATPVTQTAVSLKVRIKGDN